MICNIAIDDSDLLRSFPSNKSMAKTVTAYVGTYTGSGSQGIYAISLNQDTGEMKRLGLAAKTENPSFLAIHPNGRYVYAVNETNSGSISAFSRDQDSHQLRFLNEKPSGGGAPCHLMLDAPQRNLLVANYGGGSVSVTRVNADGSLGEQTDFVQHQGSSVNQRRQSSPHAHSINVAPNNKWAMVADLGTDEIITYALDSKGGKLVASSKVSLLPGSGPRHFAFNPKSSHAYAINELLSTITVFEFDRVAGTLSELQTIPTLPRDFEENSSTAEVRVSSDGHFVYGSNRGHDSIAVYRVQPDHRLLLVQIQRLNGKTPRNFNLDPSGKFLLAAAQGTDKILSFSIDEQSGKLGETPYSVSVPTPVCIRFLDYGKQR